MKKAILIVTLVVGCFFNTLNANAMTEKELRDKLTKTYTINGTSWKLSSDKVKILDDYLKINEISSADCDVIASKVDSAVEVIKSGNAKSIKTLSTSQKNSIKSLITDISNSTSVKATLLGNGNIKLYNVDGSEFGVLNDGISEQTSSINLMTITSLVSLVGIIAILFNTKKINEK